MFIPIIYMIPYDEIELFPSNATRILVVMYNIEVSMNWSSESFLWNQLTIECGHHKYLRPIWHSFAWPQLLTKVHGGTGADEGKKIVLLAHSLFRWERYKCLLLQRNYSLSRSMAKAPPNRAKMCHSITLRGDYGFEKSSQVGPVNSLQTLLSWV